MRPLAVLTINGTSPNEPPLLINPLVENPSDHLRVDTETGLMIDKTKCGRMCIQIFGLNIRDRLAENRSKAIDHVKSALDKIIHNPAKRQEAIEDLQKIREGKTEYSLAAQTYMDEIAPKLEFLFT